MQEVVEQLVEHERFFQIHRVAGLRNDRQPCLGHRALDQQRRLQARLVFVAAHHQQRHVDGRDARRQLVQARAPPLIAFHRVGRAGGRVLRQLGSVLGETPRVLVQVLHARRAMAVGGRELRHAVAADRAGAFDRFLLERLVLGRMCPRAAADQRQRQGARCCGHGAVGHAEMQHGERTHRAAHQVRSLDAQGVEHGNDVVPHAFLRISVRPIRHVGRRVPARAVRNAVIAPREMAQLRFPAAMVTRKLVNKHDRRAAAGFLEVQVDAVVGAYRWHACLRRGFDRRDRVAPAPSDVVTRRIFAGQSTAGTPDRDAIAAPRFRIS